MQTGGILSNAVRYEYPPSLKLVVGPRNRELFTGLVETLASIVAVTPEGTGRRFAVAATALELSPQLGDSIAINGCCLTVVKIIGSGMGQSIEFEAGQETLSKTNLGQLVVGSLVNLERSLRVGDRLGGHYVTGHVDSTIRLRERRDDPPWAFLRFDLPANLAGQVADKGSVTIDGVSLTVVDAAADSFSVALIPHTLDVTTLGRLQVGDHVNFETDVLAKYVQRSLQYAGTSPIPNLES